MSGQFPQFVRAMPFVARELLGEPNALLSSEREMRFGSYGSVSVNTEKGTFFDHENGDVGGGVVDLVCWKQNLPDDDEGRRAALAWLSERGHIPTAVAPDKPKIVKAYDYFGADGALAFQVVRLEPKSFRQRRPDGAGGWIWKMAGVDLIPFRLPEVLSAVAAGQTIYIVEGEKSADALAQLGLAATCSPGGAGKWRSAYSSHLEHVPIDWNQSIGTCSRKHKC